MGIQDLGSKLNDDDLIATRKSNDPNALDDDFSSDSLGDIFGSSNDDFFGSSSDDLFGNNDFFGSSFGNGGMNSTQRVDNTGSTGKTDKFFDNLCAFLKDMGLLTVDVIKSLKLRTLDDLGDIGRLGVLVGGGITISGVILSVIGMLGGFNLGSLSSTIIFSGGTSLFLSLIFVGLSVYIITRFELGSKGSVTGIHDMDTFLDNSVYFYNSNNDDFSEDESALNMGILDANYDCFDDKSDIETSDDTYNLTDVWGSNDGIDDFGSDFDNNSFGSAFDGAFDEAFESAFNDLNDSIEDTNATDKLDNINKVPILSRGYLYDTFIDLYARNTYEFNKREELARDSDDYITIKTLALKALANAYKREYSEVLGLTDVVSITITLYTYEIVIKRITNLTDTNRISLEMLAFFGKDSDDKSVNVKTTLEGDNYLVVVNKDEKHLVTLGDILSIDKYREHFRSSKVMLPCIVGIKPDGSCLAVDLKNFDSMLIAGKPRSGKSWYVLSLLLPLMTFCTPTDVQFLIVDPKESNLFKKIARLPHVCGLHSGLKGNSGLDILEIFDTLVNVEGAYRKRVLNEHGVDTIWELKDMGIDLPVLFVVVDEVITIKGYLEDKEDSKRFDSLLKTVITQLPSLGIRLLLVPHRAQGVLDKTIRTNIAYACAVKADKEVIKETLDIKQWDIALKDTGDIAIKLNGYPQAEFVRSPVIGDSDSNVNKFIETVGKYWDKLDAELPDMCNLGMCNNRDYLYMNDSRCMQAELSNIQDLL